GARQVVAVPEVDLGPDLELAAQVHEEGGVGDVADAEAVHRGDPRAHLLHVRLVARVGRDVDDHAVAGRLDDVDAGDGGAGVADRRDEGGRRAGAGRGLDTDRDRVAGAGDRHQVPPKV